MLELISEMLHQYTSTIRYIVHDFKYTIGLLDAVIRANFYVNVYCSSLLENIKIISRVFHLLNCIYMYPLCIFMHYIVLLHK